MVLETERLLIRSTTLGDYEGSKAIWLHPLVTHFTGGPPSEDELRAAFLRDLAKNAGDYCFRVVSDRSTKDHLGDAGLIQKRLQGKDEVELVYFFRPDTWGKGFATEAARALLEYGRTELGLRRIIALIHPDNHASKRVAEKAGLGFAGEVTTESGNLRHLYVWNDIPRES